MDKNFYKVLQRPRQRALGAAHVSTLPVGRSVSVLDGPELAGQWWTAEGRLPSGRGSIGVKVRCSVRLRAKGYWEMHRDKLGVRLGYVPVCSSLSGRHLTQISFPMLVVQRCIMF